MGEPTALADGREKRSTAGRRMKTLMDEEADEDEAFWGQDAFADDECDDEYETESNVSEDRVDSDFDDEESSEDEDSGDDREKRLAREERGRKKVLRAPGWKAEQQKKRAEQKRKRVAAAGAADADADAAAAHRGAAAGPSGRAPTRRRADRGGGAAAAGGGAALRQSSRSLVLERRAAAEEEAQRERERLKLRRRPGKRASGAGAQEPPPLTQEQLLAEAAQTEIANLRSLEELQKIEEAVKQRARSEGIKQQYTGTVIRYLSTTRWLNVHARGAAAAPARAPPQQSAAPPRPPRQFTAVAVARRDASGALERRAAHTVCADGQIRPVARNDGGEVSVADALGLPGKRGMPAPAERQVCAVTGLPAKYLDPLTRRPFASVEAFRELRRRAAAGR